MIPIEIQKKIKDLREELNQANHEYYIKENSSLTDFEYDKKFKELLTLENEYPDSIVEESPTQRIGSNPAIEFNTVEHNIPMLSLSNVFNLDELKDWIVRTSKTADKNIFPLVCELKIDGLAVSVKFQNNLLNQASTRGNGAIGEDITNNVKTIRSIPLKINNSKNIEARGEIYFPISKFNQYNESRELAGLNSYSNPRNASSGSVRQLDPSETSKRPINIFFYNLFDEEGKEIVHSHYKSLEILENLGLRIEKNSKQVHNFEDLENYILFWSKNRSKLDYGTDGIVIKIDDINIQKKLGTSGRNPRWATSYKFPPEVVETKLNKINFNVGRTGVLTPWAELEPVIIDGVKISRATLHNRDEIERKDIRENDLVELQRAGEVIPQIIKVSNKNSRNNISKKFEFPDYCPDPCKSKLLSDPNEVSVRCVSSSCPNKFERLLQYFSSKKCMDIEGLGSKICSILYKEGFINTLDEIYSLEQKRKELMELEGFGEISINKLLKNIEDSKNRSFNNLLTAFGIEGVGEEIADLITERIQSLDILYEKKNDLHNLEELLIDIEGIGPIVTNKIIEWMKQEGNIILIENFMNLGIGTKNRNVTNQSNSLNNKTFVITGRFEDYNRSTLENMIKSNGGKVINRISSKTDYLLQGENPGSKLSEAKNKSIAIISLSDFLQIISTKESNFS